MEYVQASPMHDSNHEDDVIDTLSLSDFMIYDNNGDPQEFYRLDDENGPSDFDDHEFEFSSELLKTSMNNSVVFCGKIIPYKDTIVSPNIHKFESKKLQKSHKQRWKLFKKSSKSKSHDYSDKLDLKYEVPIRRVSILASATKPRWYLLMFGIGSNSFSAQMHITDLKKRQTFMGSTKDRKNDKKSRGNDGRSASWSLVRLLGCGGGGGGGSRGDDSYHRPIAIKNLD